MKKLLIVMTAFALMMFSCQGKRTAAPTSEPTVDSTAVADSIDTVPEDTMEQLITETQMPRAADELFDDFIFNFAANRKLQRERIVFPLPLVKGGKQRTLSAQQWEIDHFFMRQGFYTLIFDSRDQLELVKDTSVSKAIVEKIYLDENLVKRYMFSRIRGVWMLREIQEMTIDEHPDASFLDFYYDFAEDEDFQVESLGETVRFVGPDPDDDFSQMEGIITPDTWPAFAPEMPTGMLYNIIYGDEHAPTGTKIFVIRGIANGMEIEMEFQQKGSKWKLTRLAT